MRRITLVGASRAAKQARLAAEEETRYELARAAAEAVFSHFPREGGGRVWPSHQPYIGASPDFEQRRADEERLGAELRARRKRVVTQTGPVYKPGGSYRRDEEGGTYAWRRHAREEEEEQLERWAGREDERKRARVDEESAREALDADDERVTQAAERAYQLARRRRAASEQQQQWRERQRRNTSTASYLEHLGANGIFWPFTSLPNWVQRYATKEHLMNEERFALWYFLWVNGMSPGGARGAILRGGTYDKGAVNQLNWLVGKAEKDPKYLYQRYRTWDMALGKNVNPR